MSMPRSRYSKAWIEVPVSQGEAVAALPDGTLIKAENAPEHAAVFKVILIDPSERDAWAWIKSCLGDKAELHQAYDLSFEDDEGERISIDQAMISIADDDTLGRSVYSLGIEGDASKLESYSAHETICFRGNDHRYYAVILGAPSDLPEDIGSPPTSVQHEGRPAIVNDRFRNDVSYADQKKGIETFVSLKRIIYRNETDEEAGSIR